jgi:hypothetical protein
MTNSKAAKGTVANVISDSISNSQANFIHLRIPAARSARGVQNHSPLKTEGVGNAGCPMHPQPRVRNETKHTSVVTTGSPGSPGIPARNGFNGLFRALPGERIRLVTVIGGLRFCQTRSDPTRLRKFSTSNGCQDHTVLPSANSVCRPHAVYRSRGSSRPAITSRARRCRVHRIPPRVNDDGQRPSVGRDGGGYRSDLGERGTEIFLQMGLDRIH